MNISKLIGTSAVAALLTVGMAAHAAPGNGKGERASLYAPTVCAVEGTNLEVITRLHNTSSGNAIPDVVSTTYVGLAKVGKGNWGNQQPFDMAAGDFVGLVFDYAESHASLDLCQLKDLGILDYSKAVNVMATINYDRDSGGDPKSISNMCSDDLTTDVVEPDGIALTGAMIAAIEAGCD